MQHTVFSREQAAKRAEQERSATAGMCQAWTGAMIGSPGVGDVNGDGDADAVDGWKSEPNRFRHTDRKAPRGTPVAFSGGSQGYGHRAVSLGVKGTNTQATIRSIDYNGQTKRYQPGVVGTGLISEIERAFGTIEYTGWSETMNGRMIKNDNPHAGRGPKVEHAIDDLDKAKGKGRRRKLINRAKKLLEKIKSLGHKK